MTRAAGGEAQLASGAHLLPYIVRPAVQGMARQAGLGRWVRELSVSASGLSVSECMNDWRRRDSGQSCASLLSLFIECANGVGDCTCVCTGWLAALPVQTGYELEPVFGDLFARMQLI